LQGSSSQQEKTPSAEASAPSAEKPAAPDSSMNNILQRLQEMENDDRSNPQLKTAPSKEGEKRPW